MSSNPRYEVLQNHDDDVPNPAAVDAVENHEATSDPNNVGSLPPNVSPPPYTSDIGSSNVEFSNEPPPQYTDVVKLPTYNESENIDDEPEPTNGNRSIFLYWLNNDAYNNFDSSQEIGSDAGFMFSFLLALFFNWIGFLISYCFTNSLASYYGAISGFGISLVKWAFIAKNSNWSRDFMHENPWFCYAFVIFGWVIFMRGIFAYYQLKRLATSDGNENRGFFG